MEEIDIIELLKRVKEGKAPKLIEIDGTEYKFMKDFSDIYCIYQTKDYDDWGENENVTLNTKIKILDKPIIEKLNEYDEVLLYKTVNQIIDILNKENKDE